MTIGKRIFTAEQYKAECARVLSDDRYPAHLKEWALDNLAKMYREINEKEPPPGDEPR